MASSNGWNKVSVVVTFSVQGDYTEKDFSRDMDQFLNTPSGQGFPCYQMATAVLRKLKTATRFKVAALGRHNGAEKSRSQRSTEQHLRGIIKDLDRRVAQLERDANPHRNSPGYIGD